MLNLFLICGCSGSGKSTYMNSMAGHKLSTGQIFREYFSNVDATKATNSIGCRRRIHLL